MSIYQYAAKDKNGQTIIGTIDMASESEVIDALHKKELVVVSIEELKKNVPKYKADAKIKLDDLVIFSRQLATMIDAGIPLVQSLGILGEQIESKNLQTIIILVRQDIAAGMTFYDALAKHPQAFSELYISMAKAGESSGMLDEVLDRLATYLEKVSALIRKIRSSLVYPAVVVTMSILITGFLLLKVVPTFKKIFDTLGGTLPLPTLVLIQISEILGKYFIFVLGFLILGIVVFIRYLHTERGRYNFDSFKLKVWILGVLFRKVALAKFSRTLSTLVRSGVPILNALEIVAKTAGNKVIEQAVIKCRTSVKEGESLARPLSNSGIFPPMVTRMISVGEQTGQLEKMLSKIADFYDEQVDAAVVALTSMIEPLVIAFLGIVIGGIVIALFLPIFKVTELIGR